MDIFPINLWCGLNSLQYRLTPLWKKPVFLTQYSAIWANLSNTFESLLQENNN